MSTNPQRPNLNRANQIKSEKGDLKQSISLFDIDYAMMSYLENTVLPTLDNNGTALKIPVIYGNSERWKGARRDGVFRDNKGQIQLPVLMIRRTSITKDDTMPMIRREVSYSGITKYSKDNKYDRFTLLGKNTQPKYEIYNIKMPEYVELNYDCMCWTSYTEHLNTVVEHLNFTGQYWGDKDTFKFRTEVGEYNIVNEVGEGTERINRVEFSLNVKAYLLPETFDGESTTKKSMSIKKVVVSTETDVTANGRLEGLLTTPSPYYDNKDLIDFLSLNSSKIETPSSDNVVTFTDIKLIKTPDQLVSVISGGLTIGSIAYDVKVYVNGQRVLQTNNFTLSVTSNSMQITFLPAGLGYTVDTNDEITITGKFVEV